MDILIDSNVIIDWISRRSDFYEDSKKIVDVCFFGNINGFVTAHSLCDIYYILRKDFSVERRLALIKLISERCHVISETQDDFIDVASSPLAEELEDGLQIRCAENFSLDFIVTRNIKDFSSSSVKAVTPADFILLSA